jgi:hypothetical protein
MFVPMSTGSVFLRRFTTKTIIAQLFASDVERNGGNARRKKTSAFVTGGEFGGGRKAKEDAKNLNAGGERMTLSIESNAHKLERMTPVFCRELMAFVSANKSELYEKKVAARTRLSRGEKMRRIFGSRRVSFCPFLASVRIIIAVAIT